MSKHTTFVYLRVGQCFIVPSSAVVKALCYKPEGRGFEIGLGEFLNLPDPSGRIRPWGLLSL
jgi:hypothetical protein